MRVIRAFLTIFKSLHISAYPGLVLDGFEYHSELLAPLDLIPLSLLNSFLK